MSSGLARVAKFFEAERPEPLTTAEVLRDEFRQIWDETIKIPDEKTYLQEVHQRDQAALCLSGGGIRSAAFSLGVLQMLAQRGLLTQFHYLSTVSGGGYIGAWLSRWIREHPEQDARAVCQVLGMNPGGPPKEIRQISALRENSNFLTPQTGIASTDLWTGVMLWVRNVLLNWMVFLPALLIAVFVPNFYLALLIAAVPPASYRPAELFGMPVAAMLLVIGAAALFVATWNATRYLPSHQTPSKLNSARVRGRIVIPALVWSVAVPAIVVAANYPSVAPGGNDIQFFGFSFHVITWIVSVGLAVKVAAYSLAWAVAAPADRKTFKDNFFTWLWVSTVAAFAVWLAIYVIERLSSLLPVTDTLIPALDGYAGGNSMARLVVLMCILGPFGVVLAHLLLSTLYVGFRDAKFQDDADREWLGRLSAMSVFPTILWALFAATCLLLPWLLFDTHGLAGWAGKVESAAKWLTAVIGVVSGLFAVIGGQSPAAKLDAVASPADRRSAYLFELAIKVATLIFVTLLLACLARSERIVAETIGAAAAGLSGLTFVLPSHLILAHSVLVVGLLLALLISSRRIDVNRYSLHGVYRNRLVRTFLGAARAKRPAANPFTLFDAEDNVRMHELAAQVDGKRRLFPVINMTLNLVGGDNLAWQERKASAFIVTPLACGSATLRKEPNVPPNMPTVYRGAYVRSQDYGGNEPDLRLKGNRLQPEADTTGISLGTAMTISGAAVSPSQGYHSAPATAFLMTLFNVRLGAWLANPAARLKAGQKGSGPTNALFPLMVEAFGWTSDKNENIYLSDGGHFDNLGLYEMVRRRCRFIVIVDADADKSFSFEDLGKAVRQVVVDLDANIDFKSMKLKSARLSDDAAATYAVGRIEYGENPADPGWLIYIKPTYFPETAPIDVRSYGSVSDDFPHESTLDQWFSESQFESYRRLGYYLTNKLCPNRSAESLTLVQLFSEAARQTIEPRVPPGPPPVPAQSERPPRQAAAKARSFVKRKEKKKR